MMRTLETVPLFALACFCITVHLVLIPSASGQATQPLHGFVERHSDHLSLPGAKIGIRNIDASEANRDGEFALNVPVTMQNGYPLDFYVTGWIVYSPNVDGLYGRMPFVGFDPQKYKLVVVKPGDKVLISDLGVHNLLLSAMSDFGRLSEKYTAFQPGVASPWLLPVNTVAQTDPAADALFHHWLSEQSSALGLSEKDIAQAINVWTEQAKSPFDQGLADLYRGRLNAAIDKFLKSRDTGAAALKAVAFAYGLQRDWSSAAHYLELSIQKGYSNDPIMYSNLGDVLEFDGKSTAASEARKRAAEIIAQNVGQQPQTQEQPLVPRLGPSNSNDSDIPSYMLGTWTGVVERVDGESFHVQVLIGSTAPKCLFIIDEQERVVRECRVGMQRPADDGSIMFPLSVWDNKEGSNLSFVNCILDREHRVITGVYPDRAASGEVGLKIVLHRDKDIE